jgi:hypothetical protein
LRALYYNLCGVLRPLEDRIIFTMTAAEQEQAVAPTGAQEPSGASSMSSSQLNSPEDKADEDDFTLSNRGKLVFVTLAVLTLMAALDGTSLSVALPV